MYNHITNALASTLRTPQYLILFVSDRCWMKCKHCWYNEEWKADNLAGRELSTEEIERIASSIKHLHFLSLTGGEAFRRGDIVDVTTIFAREAGLRRYQIPTSGFMPEMIIQKTERMLEANPGIPFRVDVSLDGTEATHEKIRLVKGGFARAVATIRGLNDLKKACSHFDVGIISTISKFNQDEVEEMAALMEEIHPDGEWMVNITRGETRDVSSIDVDIENYWKAHELIAERIARGGYTGHSGHFTASWLSAKNAARRIVIKDILTGKEKGGGCSAGSLGGVILNDGQIMPCEMLDMPIGNIRDFDYDLRDAWNSDRAREIRNWIQDTRCLCTQECFLSTSLLIQPRHWGKILRERARLALN